MIEIQKINDTHMKISCDQSIEYELQDNFSYKVLNHRFHPKVKAGIWDGVIRMFNRKDKTMKVGLLDKLIEFMNNSEYEYKLDQKLGKKLTEENVRDFVEHLKIPEHIEKRDYQIDSIIDCIVNRRRLLLSPTSSGKSFIIYAIIRYFNVKTLLLVPRISLVDQMWDDFHEYSKNDNWNPADYCTKIYGNAKKDDKENPKLISISTWHSMNNLKHLYEDFEMVIVDEAHEGKAPVITSILDACVNAEYRYGFTGTLDGVECNEMLLNGLFGKTIQYIKTKELIEQNYAAKLNIICFVLKYKQSIEELKKLNKTVKAKTKALVGRKKYDNELDLIMNHKRRNNFICKFTMKLQGNTLIYFNRIEGHGKVLQEIFEKNLSKETHNLFYIDGSIDDRNDIRKAMESREKNNIGLFSAGTSSVGMSIKNIDNILFCYTSKARITVLQTIGRGLRMSDTKQKVTFYDFTDILSSNKKNYSYLHFIERLKMYKDEGHNYTIKEIEIE